MAEMAAPAVPVPLNLDFDRVMRAAQRIFSFLAFINIFWSIAVTSGLLSGLSLKIFQSPGYEFTIGFWIIQQWALRFLIVVAFFGLVMGSLRHRGDNSGYFTRSAVNMFGMIVLWLIVERVFVVTLTSHYILTVWGQQVSNGLIQGSLYALVALGYTLVYGILLMINFAHGDVMMIGSYFGFFALQLFRGDPWIFLPRDAQGFVPSILATIFMMVFVLAVAMIGAMFTGLAVERIAYRPLRRAPRLAPLISAIGMSFFLEQAAQRILGPIQRSFDRPTLLSGTFLINRGKEFGPPIPIS